MRLIEQDGRYGPSVARNAGVEAAQSAITILLDADLVPSTEFVASHVAFRALYPDTIGCGRILPYEPAYTSYLDRAAKPEFALDRGGVSDELPFYQAFSGNLSLTPEIFRSVGGFDSQLRAFEDIDFAYRAHRQGIAVRNCPDAIAYHNHPRSLAQRCEQARAYNRMVPVLLERYPETTRKTAFCQRIRGD